MARADRQQYLSTALVGAALTAAVVVVFWFGLLESMELGLYDLRARNFQRWTPKPTDRIVHVDIDDAALEAIGAWPWPRTVMAEAIDELNAAGVKAVALDVLYTEPQEPVWRPETPGDPTGRYRLTDHDGNLSGAMVRAWNVILPGSLQFVPAQRQTPAVIAAGKVFAADLETTPDALASALRAQGFAERDIEDVGAIFYDLRRAAAKARALKELSTRAAATQPAKHLATQPADPRSIVLARRRLLFPSIDPVLASPEARLADEAFEYARTAMAFRRLGRPVAPEVPVFANRSNMLPVPVLMESAAATAFVDYPNLGDGTIRNVPVIVESNGRLHLTLGLRLACMLLEVPPEQLVITPDGVTVPAGKMSDGTDRAALTIPLRTGSHVLSSGRTIEIPLVMDIPFFGPRQWWAMYDPARPERRAQHVSMAEVWNVVRARQKWQTTTAGADRAARNLLEEIARIAPELAENGKAYDARAITDLKDPAANEATIAWLLALVEPLGITPGQPTNLPNQSDTERKVLWACDALAAAQKGMKPLEAAMRAERASLRQRLSGKGVLIGWTAAAALADVKPTPLHAEAPGVVVHGVVANAVLTGNVWRMLPRGVTVAVAILLGLLATFFITRFSAVKAFVAVLTLVAGYVVVNCVLLFDYGNTLLDLGTPVAAIAAAWSGGLIARLVGEARERARITRRFSTYVDPDIVNYFLETRDESQLAGKRQDTTVVFTDLEGFTTLSERLGEDVVPVLNDFMGRAVHVIKKHRGIVNKFLGDGILFFFNAPRPNSTYVADAMDCILDLQQMMVGFNEDLKAQGLTPLRLRAGVTTGATITGDAGSQGRTDYTVIGDLVNLAARLESANKFFGTANLVTRATVDRAGDRFLFRPVGSIVVMGKQQGVEVYETMAYAKDATDDQRTLAAQMRVLTDAFASGDAARTLAAVEQLEAITGPTKLTKAYRAVAEPYVTGSAEGSMPRVLVLDAK
jgi:class 3 adenylate cyclase/CHASE2 domain-containing sensor protein